MTLHKQFTNILHPTNIASMKKTHNGLRRNINIIDFLSYLDSACLPVHPPRVEGANWEEERDQSKGARVTIEGIGDKYKQSTVTQPYENVIKKQCFFCMLT